MRKRPSHHLYDPILDGRPLEASSSTSPSIRRLVCSCVSDVDDCRSSNPSATFHLGFDTVTAQVCAVPFARRTHRETRALADEKQGARDSR
jgi:hypothetical protein